MFGADILARMLKAHEGEGERLQVLLIDILRELTNELLVRAGCSTAAVAAVAAAGNPGISYLLRNLPVEEILFPPHRPRQCGLVSLPTHLIDIGVSAPLQLFPLISGFVGGDLIAFLLGFDSPTPGTVCIDIGTNGELALWDGARWWVTSAAAGPAFEAGNITCGMPAGPGAVADVHLLDDRLQLQVLDGGRPRGLCGSGLAALIGELVEGGLVDSGGRILGPDEVDSNLSRYLDGHGNLRFYRDATGGLLLTQADLRNFQLAKGALRAGLDVLLDRAGFEEQNLHAIFITGAFGTALPVECLKKVALLPAGMVDKTFFVPNGVLAGLARYLTDADGAERLQGLLSMIQVFPLSGTPAFEKRFLGSLGF
jgi:uncharacterized 2Fe-2S/4Fe-4S cluster protein (DUF4445 family)